MLLLIHLFFDFSGSEYIRLLGNIFRHIQCHATLTQQRFAIRNIRFDFEHACHCLDYNRNLLATLLTIYRNTGKQLQKFLGAFSSNQRHKIIAAQPSDDFLTICILHQSPGVALQNLIRFLLTKPAVHQTKALQIEIVCIVFGQLFLLK